MDENTLKTIISSYLPSGSVIKTISRSKDYTISGLSKYDGGRNYPQHNGKDILLLDTPSTIKTADLFLEVLCLLISEAIKNDEVPNTKSFHVILKNQKYPNFSTYESCYLAVVKAVFEIENPKISEFDTKYPDEESVLVEGATKKVFVNKYERNKQARNSCIKHYGLSCVVCDFNFETKYGELGKDFIHVHHLVLISKPKKEYVVDPINDLRPVCPNCHAMLHAGNISTEELRERIRSQNKS